MLIVADENMPLLAEFFADLGEIRTFSGRTMKPSDVAGADLLLVRSVTRVDAALLRNSRPRFIGSATIGTDHIDLPLLKERGVPFAAAPGCNAVAVGEYVATVLALSAEKSAAQSATQGTGGGPWRVGVVGYGNAGREVLSRVQALGHAVAVCDPLLPAASLPAGIPALTLDEMLDWADVLTLHVPLSREGEHATWHLFDAARLRRGRWHLLINSARGPVIDNTALSALLAEDPRRRAVLDVWEAEPAVPSRLLAQVDYGTPHVAGYSVEGKWRGTAMLYEAACRHLGMTPTTNLAAIRIARGDHPQILRWAGSVATTLASVCDVPSDDVRLRAAVSDDAVATARAFDDLRRNYPERREFAHYRLVGLPAEQRSTETPTKTPRTVLAALGFGVPG